MSEDFLLSIDIMWKGMVGIFSVIILITLIVILFQWFEKKFSTKKEEN